MNFNKLVFLCAWQFFPARPFHSARQEGWLIQVRLVEAILFKTVLVNKDHHRFFDYYCYYENGYLSRKLVIHVSLVYSNCFEID